LAGNEDAPAVRQHKDANDASHAVGDRHLEPVVQWATSSKVSHPKCSLTIEASRTRKEMLCAVRALGQTKNVRIIPGVAQAYSGTVAGNHPYASFVCSCQQ